MDGEVQVYGDLLFLINMSMDFLCFHLTARLLHRTTSLLRFILAAIIGGIYSVLALLFEVTDVTAFVIDIAVCLGMCLVAFGRKRTSEESKVCSLGVKGLLGFFGVYMVISMVIGGVMTAFYNLLNRSGLPDILPDVENDGISAWLFGILAALAGLMALMGGKIFRRSTAARPCEVTIELFGKSVVLDGMCDSGNLMRDPASGRAVVAADKMFLGSIIDEQTMRCLMMGERGISELASVSAYDGSRLLHKLRIIPMGTATGRGLLIAVIPDRMIIRPSGKDAHEVNALFAPIDMGSGEKDGKGTLSGEPQALVPSELMM